jgi:hypothetical protein
LWSRPWHLDIPYLSLSPRPRSPPSLCRKTNHRHQFALGQELSSPRWRSCASNLLGSACHLVFFSCYFFSAMAIFASNI